MMNNVRHRFRHGRIKMVPVGDSHERFQIGGSQIIYFFSLNLMSCTKLHKT